MKVLLVYNPIAGHKKAAKMLPEVISYFSENKVDVDLKQTKFPGHGRDIVSKADFNKYAGIVAAGGDGTVFEVINGFYLNKSTKKIPVGIVPQGTANAFMRDLELVGSAWRDAVNIISDGKTRKVDVGQFIIDNKDYYFLNIMGFGFVTDVVETAIRFKAFGNIAYTFGVLQRILFLKDYRLTIEADGKTIERQNNFVEISNTRWASNFLMAPNAEMDDGFLDVTLANSLTRRRLLKIFPKVFTGEHIKEPEIETFQAKKIYFETDVPKILAPDGELIGTTPVEVNCLHKDLELFWK